MYLQTTEVYMLQDKSEDFEDTWKFLDRRFDDVAGVGGVLSFSQDMFQGERTPDNQVYHIVFI